MKFPELESQTLEFKQEIPKNAQITKTIIGFCNRSGGTLMIGVKDDGTIVGVDETAALTLMEWLEQAVYMASSPPIIPSVLLQRFGDKVVLVVRVSSGMNKPYYRKSEGLDLGTYVRIGRSTVRASAEMIEELRWGSKGLSYDRMAVHHGSEDDLDLKKFQGFLDSRKSKGEARVSAQVLQSYHLVKEEHGTVYPTVAGVLLFGRDPGHWFSEAMIICTHFSGVRGREAIATIDCEGTLFEQYESALNFVVSRLHRSFTIKRSRRQEQLELPEVVIRELLLNALIHRNYFLKAPTKVAIYDDRVEIFSPGSFPTPFSSLRLGLTDVRNMAVCKVFREAGYVEKLGTGFLTVFDACAEAKLPTPEVVNGERFVKAVIWRSTAGQTGPGEGALDRLYSLFLSTDELAISDVMSRLGWSRSTAARRLSELVEQGRIEKLGVGKGTRYFKA